MNLAKFKKNFNLPNVLTIIRILLGPIIMYLILNDSSLTAIGLFIIALLTDFIDGKIARKFDAETNFGKIVDPFADKIMYAFVIFGIMIKNSLVIWILFYSLIAIFFILSYRLFLRKNMVVSNLGKIIISLKGLLLIFMIYGYVNNYILGLFALLLIIPPIYYILCYKSKKQNKQKQKQKKK